MSAIRNAAYRAAAAVLIDTVVDKNPSIGFYVGVTGDVKVTGMDGVAVTFKAVPAGQIIPLRTKQIWATGTTAGSIVVLYAGA